MKRFGSGIGILQGSRVLFSDFADGGMMWTGSGNRESRFLVAFKDRRSMTRPWSPSASRCGTWTTRPTPAPTSPPRMSPPRAFTSCFAPGAIPASRGSAPTGWPSARSATTTIGMWPVRAGSRPYRAGSGPRPRPRPSIRQDTSRARHQDPPDDARHAASVAGIIAQAGSPAQRTRRAHAARLKTAHHKAPSARWMQHGRTGKPTTPISRRSGRIRPQGQILHRQHRYPRLRRADRTPAPIRGAKSVPSRQPFDVGWSGR